MNTEMFRIVDEAGNVYSGFNNVLRMYRSLGKAQLQSKAELTRIGNAIERRNRLYPDQEPGALPKLRIQSARLEWKDVE